MAYGDNFNIDEFTGKLGAKGGYNKDVAEAINYGFLPRYSRASSDVYKRGFNTKGSMYNKGLQAVDRDLISSLVTTLPGLDFQQQGLTNQANQIANNYALGLRSADLAEDTFGFNRQQAGRSSLGKLFGF